MLQSKCQQVLHIGAPEHDACANACSFDTWGFLTVL